MNLTAAEVFLDGINKINKINKIFLIFLYPEHPARPPRLAGSHGGQVHPVQNKEIPIQLNY